jgi:hypothetical protein
VAASVIAGDTERDASSEDTRADAIAASEPMRYEDLLPYLLLPMAGAY